MYSFFICSNLALPNHIFSGQVLRSPRHEKLDWSWTQLQSRKDAEAFGNKARKKSGICFVTFSWTNKNREKRSWRLSKKKTKREEIRKKIKVTKSKRQLVLTFAKIEAVHNNGAHWLMLAYVGAYWLMLAYAGACWRMLAHVGTCQRWSVHVGPCWRMLALVDVSIHWYALALALIE